jgi:hypothetical protein
MLATITALSLEFGGGCKTEEKKTEPSSSVVVETQADGIHLKTAQAEFVLSAAGSLSGRLKNGTEWLSLDETTPGTGVVVTSGKKEIGDFVRDLAQAQIQPANGKLGALGKRVVVRGHSASTGARHLGDRAHARRVRGDRQDRRVRVPPPGLVERLLTGRAAR